MAYKKTKNKGKFSINLLYKFSVFVQKYNKEFPKSTVQRDKKNN